jgi:hypothetical protein
MSESMRAIKAYTVRTSFDRITRIIAILIFLMIAFLVGCGGEKIPPHLTDEVGTFIGVLEIKPYPPAPMQDTTLQLILTDSGQPVQGAIIELMLTMPDCTMPPSFLTGAEIGEGNYQVQTVLTMAGAWQVDASVSVQGKNEELTFFFATK